MKILVCGGRDFTNKFLLNKVLSEYLKCPIERIIEGGARGADALAADWAHHNNIPSSRYIANWNKYGRSAGTLRNKVMLDEGKPTIVIAFPGGFGTANMIKQAKNAHIKVIEVEEINE